MQILWLLALLVGVPAMAIDLKGVQLGAVANEATLTAQLGLKFTGMHCEMYRSRAHGGPYNCDSDSVVMLGAVPVSITCNVVLDRSGEHIARRALAHCSRYCAVGAGTAIRLR